MLLRPSSPSTSSLMESGTIRDPRRREKVDVRSLEKRLKSRVQGEVRFDDGSRGLYALDSSNYTQIPLGVVIPKDSADVVATVEICREYGAPILPRGGGTSLSGSTVNVAVVLDFSKYMNRVLEVNREEKWARIQPGVILDDLRDAADEVGLTFGPDPSTHDRCVLGGMIGNNSCGTHAQMAGRVSENVIELEILTYDGLRMRVGRTSDRAFQEILKERGRRSEIYSSLKTLADRYGSLIRSRFPRIPRRVSGYNLDYLLPENGFDVARALVGSEGTLVTVLEAKVRLVYSAPKRTLVTLGYPDIFAAGDAVPEILLSGPIAVEAIDHKLLEYVKTKGGKKAHELGILPEGKSFLMVEFDGETRSEADAKARRLIQQLKRKGFPSEKIRLFEDQNEHILWDIRESGLGATAFVPGKPDSWPGWEDAGVPPDKLGDYLRDYRKLLDKHNLDCSVYGHFGQGCVHCRITFDLMTKKGVERYRAFIEDAADLCSRYGGSYSGEHGDGQARGELWGKLFGPELVEAMRHFKSIWDPQYKMNPGKLVGNPPYKLDENLRLGPHYKQKPLKTHFQYPSDEKSFNHATLRCVGVGKCRRTTGGYMCPSYMVTREEAHSTRGRAHLLYDMVQGNAIKDGWKSDDVKAALDLCLACKGCKGDCPVSVDVATMKAEFLSHYYEGRFRPRYAYALGWVHLWAKLASLAPGVANLLTQLPILSGLMKKLGGIAPERSLPPFAMETFTEWFRRRPEKQGGSPVLLWPDTFNNFFYPEVGKATVEVLEDAGFRVLLPTKDLCCGRPLYDYGFLDQAKQRLREILDHLEKPIEYGIPLIGMEPSCLVVFRDELINLFPEDERAQKLSRQSFMLGEFLNKKTSYRPPQLKGKALIQGHCHQAAVVGVDDEKAVLKKMGLEAEVLDAGCCGQAGSFGFEADKYDISVKIAHHRLVPQLEKAPKDTYVVANGFSCHSQIKDTTDRKALHLAQVIQMGLRSQKQHETSKKKISEVRQVTKTNLAAVIALGIVVGLVSRRYDGHSKRTLKS